MEGTDAKLCDFASPAVPGWLLAFVFFTPVQNPHASDPRQSACRSPVRPLVHRRHDHLSTSASTINQLTAFITHCRSPSPTPFILFHPLIDSHSSKPTANQSNQSVPFCEFGKPHRLARNPNVPVPCQETSHARHHQNSLPRHLRLVLPKVRRNSRSRIPRWISRNPLPQRFLDRPQIPIRTAARRISSGSEMRADFRISISVVAIQFFEIDGSRSNAECDLNSKILR